MNIYEKLNLARIEFLQSGIKKTGKNIKQAYMYFQLADIIPQAEEVFKKYKLLKVDSIWGSVFTSRVYNCENPEEHIDFQVPFEVADPIISRNTGGEVTNVVQRIGSSITYIRRYSWQLVLDIVEADLIDGDGVVEEVPVKAEPKAEVKEEQKAALVEVLTSADEPANELQITALKNLLKELRDKGMVDLAKQVLLDTHLLKEVSKNQAEIIINQLTEKLSSSKQIDISDDLLPF